jgi:hypothetical protein
MNNGQEERLNVTNQGGQTANPRATIVCGSPTKTSTLTNTSYTTGLATTRIHSRTFHKGLEDINTEIPQLQNKFLRSIRKSLCCNPVISINGVE